MIPKETSVPLEEGLQMHYSDDDLPNDFVHTIQPIDIYAPIDITYIQPDPTDIYCTTPEMNTLVYESVMAGQSNSPTEVIELQDTDDETEVATKETKKASQTLILSDLDILTFVCTQQDRHSIYLAQPNDRVRKSWYKRQIQYEPHVNPEFANDLQSYKLVSEISHFTPNVIHATYLDSNGTTHPNLLFLNTNSTLTSHLPSGLSLYTLFDTGCHKVLLNRKFYDQHKSQFDNFMRVPFHENHQITVGNGELISAMEMISIPILIQKKLFTFLALIVDILDDYDFVIGLEAMIQLGCLYDLPSQTLQISQRSIPLYPHKCVTVPPQTTSLIHLQGALPCSFTSGNAIIYVAPLSKDFSFITFEAFFVDQTVILQITNEGQTPRYFSDSHAFAYFDLRSIGYDNFPSPNKLFSSPVHPPTKYLTDFMATTFHATPPLPQPPPIGPLDPYPWLDANDPRRFKTDREILESAINLSDSCLTEAQRIEFYDVLEEHKDAFSLRDEIGLAPNFQVHLELKDKTPFFIRPFAVKESMKQYINKEMKRLVNLGILKKGLSGYSSPVFAIPRKNSTIPRIVSDFRVLNTKLVTLNHSFTLVRDVIQAIGASQCDILTVIDLRDAFHTLRLDTESQQYCGITPYYGADTYIYQRLAMGLSVAPSIWQSFINSVLGNIPNRNRYIAIMDDCLIFTKFNDHIQDLKNLFKNLIAYGLKISPRKCQFFRQKITYMGMQFLIDDGRPSFTPLKDKCDAIRNLLPPKTVKDCRKFCGMVNFLATFVEDLQKILVPIYNLTKKNTPFQWTEECQNSFDNIKQQLTTPPILRMPDLVGLFKLMSDTSKIAAGAALYQEQQGKFFIVGYNSKKLPHAARNYSATELELFGLTVNIYAFKTCLTNTFFQVVVDHSAIKHLLVSKHPPPTRRIEKLMMKLKPFNFTVQHLAGSKMHIADILSRLAGKDFDPPDKLVPISFLAITRSQSAKHQHSNTSRPTTTHTSPRSLPKPLPKSSSTRVTTSKQNRPPKSLVTQKPTKATNLLSPQGPTPFKPLAVKSTAPLPVGVLRPKPKTMPSNSAHKSLINPKLTIPNTLPPLDLPPPMKETIETFRPPDQSLYKTPKPVLKDFTDLDVFTRHIPKQQEIDRFIDILKTKMTTGYPLTVGAADLAKEYPNSPFFKHVYKYITQNILPKDKRIQRMVIVNAESFIVANGLLFKMAKPTKGLSNTVQFLLVIPEKFENIVFHMYHDSLLGAHYNPINTFYTIKQKFWIHNLFEKLQRYIASCDACLKQKQKRGKPRYFHPRIPLEYNPMAYLSADIKYMPKGIYGYEFLLIAVCEVTNFIVAIPLVAHDAVSIAHAMLDRIFLIFGPPKTLIIDEDRALSAKVMHYILDALKVQVKCISPYNHGSLKTERYIQTLNNLITRHLKDKGLDWPLYVMSVCFAMNTYVSPSTGFSPYELVFIKKPPDILNLYFTPIQQIAKGYRDYCLKMRARLENVSNVVMEIKTLQQQRQTHEQHLKHDTPELLQQGQLVYLLAPSAASLQTNTTKCRADYVGPLVINRVLDETHYILNDLQGQILCGVYHINRLKKAELHTDNGTVSTYDELEKVFNQPDPDNSEPIQHPAVAPAALLQSYFQLNAYKSSPILTCDCESSFTCICP